MMTLSDNDYDVISYFLYYFVILMHSLSIISLVIQINSSLVVCSFCVIFNGVPVGSGIKTHSLGGACIGDTGSELQLYVVVYCTHIELD